MDTYEIKLKIKDLQIQNSKERIELLNLQRRIQEQADEISAHIRARKGKNNDEVPNETGETIPGFLSWKETNEFFKSFN